ncbi:hypothetical protein KIPB_009009, partial [Kipferlia bialata]
APSTVRDELAALLTTHIQEEGVVETASDIDPSDILVASEVPESEAERASRLEEVEREEEKSDADSDFVPEAEAEGEGEGEGEGEEEIEGEGETVSEEEREEVEESAPQPRKTRSSSQYYTLEDMIRWDTYRHVFNIPAVESDRQPNPDINRKARPRVCIHQGNICALEMDAIVNAANSGLYAGGGVCGAIFSAAGRRVLQQACDKVSPCPAGEARMTPGFNLPVKHVIHAVGPMGSGDAILEGAYRSSLDLCLEHGLRSIAFPCISTGIFGFPNERAAHIASATVRDFLDTHPDSMDCVTFCIFGDRDLQIYKEVLGVYFP